MRTSVVLQAGAANDFLQRWHAVCNGSFILDREKFNPSDFTSLLQQMVILELGENDCLRFRLVGTAVRVACGKELTGLPMSAILSAAQEASFVAPVTRAMMQYSGCRLRGKVTTKSDEVLNVDFIFLPCLQSSNGDIQIFGFLSAVSQNNKIKDTRLNLHSITIDDYQILESDGTLPIDEDGDSANNYGRRTA